jgi:hypothetical protein
MNGAVVRRDGEVGSADDRQQVPGARVHGDERSLQPLTAKLPKSVAHGGFGRVLDFWNEAGVDFPVRRIVAAVDVAELLPQEFFRVALPRVRDG